MVRHDPFLLTPGPLTTSRATKDAMLHDWGSRDAAFIEMNARVRERLLDLGGGRGSHVCVPLQGNGTFIQEAPEDVPVSVAALDEALAGDPAITHVAVVQCETTSGS